MSQLGTELAHSFLHVSVSVGDEGGRVVKMVLARSERFELPALGIEIRCSIQLSYERVRDPIPDLPG